MSWRSLPLRWWKDDCCGHREETLQIYRFWSTRERLTKIDYCPHYCYCQMLHIPGCRVTEHLVLKCTLCSLDLGWVQQYSINEAICEHIARSNLIWTGMKFHVSLFFWWLFVIGYTAYIGGGRQYHCHVSNLFYKTILIKSFFFKKDIIKYIMLDYWTKFS